MIYRSFYSKNALMHADALIQPALPSTSSPIACGALITMCSHFARVVERLQPKYLVVAFDARGKTFRNDLFAPYKQHRTEASAPSLYLLQPLLLLVLLLLLLTHLVLLLRN